MSNNSSNNDIYSDKELSQFNKRQRSTLVYGPTFGAYGHYPSVIQNTVSEIHFADSDSALKYVKSVGVKDPNARVIQMKARTRFISRGDDDDEFK